MFVDPTSDEDEDVVEAVAHQSFANGRGDLQVTSISLSGRAQRRLSRHTARARVGGSVNSNLLLDSECSEVPCLQPVAEISSGEEDVSLTTRQARRRQRCFTARSRSPYGELSALGVRRSDSGASSSTVVTELDRELAMEDLEAPSFYVESFQSDLLPRCCNACHEFFLPGQVRLGLRLRMQNVADASSQQNLWVHAPRCFGRANFAFTLTEGIAFQSGFDDSVRARILEELVAEHARQRDRSAWPGRIVTQVPQATQPWRYESFDESWIIIVVDERVVRADPETRPVLAALDARSNLHASFEARWAEIDARLAAADMRADMAAATEDHLASRGVTSREATNKDKIDTLLESVPVLTLTAEEKEPCVICCEKLLIGEEARRLPCLHLFHRACIDEWLKVKPCCPLDKLGLEQMLTQQDSSAS